MQLSGQRTNPRALIVFERRLRILELRKSGVSFPSIESSLGLKPNTARQDLKKLLRYFVLPPLEEARKLEAERLDALMLPHWQKALSGDVAAATIVLRIMERRAKLLGLDAPERRQIETDGQLVIVYEGEDWRRTALEALAVETTVGLLEPPPNGDGDG